MKNNLMPIITIFAFSVIIVWVFSLSKTVKNNDAENTKTVTELLHIDSAMVTRVRNNYQQISDLEDRVDSLKKLIACEKMRLIL